MLFSRPPLSCSARCSVSSAVLVGGGDRHTCKFCTIPRTGKKSTGVILEVIVRADTYRRRHFSWPRVIPSFRIPANFWIFQPRDQTGERSGDCACSRIGSICKNLWERIFVKREIFPFLFTDGLKFAYSWQCLKMLFSEKIINSFVNDE